MDEWLTRLEEQIGRMERNIGRLLELAEGKGEGKEKEKKKEKATSETDKKEKQKKKTTQQQQPKDAKSKQLTNKCIERHCSPVDGCSALKPSCNRATRKSTSSIPYPRNKPIHHESRSHYV